jgi:Spy/CpxP family protein refolding chaperone
MDNYFAQNKWTAWLIGLLVLLNILLLGALWMGSKRGKPHRGPDERGHMDQRMAKELALSDEQAAQFKDLWEAHKREMNEVHDKVNTLRKQRMETLLQSNPDSTQLQLLALQIGQEQTRVEVLFSQHYFKLWAICNEAQRKELPKLFEKMMRRKRDRGEHPGGRGR